MSVAAAVGDVSWRKQAAPAAALRATRAAMGPRIGFVLLLALAVAVRIWGLGEASLTHDEAWRANFADHGTWAQRARLPVGQCILLWVIQQVAPRSEWALRAWGAAAGVAMVGLVWRSVRRRLGDGAACCAAAYAAFHAEPVSFSRVIKEVSLETLLAVVLLGAGAAAWDKLDRSNLRRLIGWTVLGLVAGFAPIFVATAWWVLLSAKVWAHGRRAPGVAREWCMGTLLVVVLGSAWYLWHSSSPYSGDVLTHFRQAEQAWPAASTPRDVLAWAGRSSLNLFRFAAGTSVMWEPMGTAVATLWALAAAAGMWRLWRTWRVGLACLAAVVALTLIAALCGKWAYGPFRNNLFLVPLAAPCVGAGLAYVIERLAVWPARVLVAGMLVVLPAARASKAAFAGSPVSEHLRPVLEAVERQLDTQDAVFVYYATDDAFEFYRPWPAAETLVEPRSDRGRPDVFERRFGELLARHPRVWLILTHPFADERREWSTRAAAHGQIVHRFSSGGADAWCIQRPSSPLEDSR